MRNNQNIIIRKADKSNIYVILNKEDYLTKIDSILSDNTKFQKINRDSTDKLKKRANRIIGALNADQSSFKLEAVVGDYSPGYLYGTVKTHKPNNPLRPIISQCPTPTYKLAKTLNNLITPFIPNQYSLRSTNDFIDILRTSNPQGIIASLDVESLFTNVPIEETIDIIIQRVYNHPTIIPPKIPKTILKQLLQICTKESPFQCPRGNYYLQIEGVAMGSPLGPTFANFYMGNLEDNIFQNFNKPNIYARYIDDIFLEIQNEQQLLDLKQTFENISVLKFTYELHTQNKLPFLDVLVTTNATNFTTTIHRKPTDQGLCLNANSECPEKYKLSVISNYLNRAYKVTQTWEDFDTELTRIKQTLVNNNFTNTLIDQQINIFLNNKFSNNTPITNHNNITLYYHNQMHNNYKTDEKILKDILKTNVTCTDPNSKLNLIIYYKNKKASNLVMKNNSSSPSPPSEQSNLVYEFKCPLAHSKATTYIGYTECTINKRTTAHFYSGSIKDHFIMDHDIKPTKQQILDNTTILAKASDKLRLMIKEALLILKYSPIINRQFQNFQHTLKLHKHRPPDDQHTINTPNNMTNSSSPTLTPNNHTLNSSTLSPTILQVQSTPQPSSTNINNVSLHTPIRHTHTLISPSIQNRIDTLLQNARIINTDTPHRATEPITHTTHNPSLPYNLRPRRR